MEERIPRVHSLERMSGCEKHSEETKSVGIPVAAYGSHMCVDLTTHTHTHVRMSHASALSFWISLNSSHPPSKASPIRQRYLLPPCVLENRDCFASILFSILFLSIRVVPLASLKKIGENLKRLPPWGFTVVRESRSGMAHCYRNAYRVWGAYVDCAR